jgi:20S proteasome alpha/beta subunit
MDFFAGIRGKDFVMVCCDTSAVHSIITIKQDEDKIVPIDSHKVFCLSGEAGDRVQFSDYIIANVKLYALRNATSLSTKSVAHYARGELAVALRKVRLSAAVAPPLWCALCPSTCMGSPAPTPYVQPPCTQPLVLPCHPCSRPTSATCS